MKRRGFSETQITIFYIENGKLSCIRKRSVERRRNECRLEILWVGGAATPADKQPLPNILNIIEFI